MAWNPNIPQPTDALSQSQQDILANFRALDPLFNEGVQPYVDLPVQGTTPTPETPGDVLLYNFNNTITGLNELYVYKNTPSSGTAQIPMTASLQGSSGWSYLPSGLIIKWGSGSATGSQVVFFPTGSGTQAFTNCFSVLVCAASANVSPSPATPPNKYIQVWQYNATQFTVWASTLVSPTATAVAYTYIAIGN